MHTEQSTLIDELISRPHSIAHGAQQQVSWECGHYGLSLSLLSSAEWNLNEPNQITSDINKDREKDPFDRGVYQLMDSSPEQNSPIIDMDRAIGLLMYYRNL